MGCYSKVTWELRPEWFGWRAIVLFSDGSILSGDYKHYSVLNRWFLRKDTAYESVKRSIEHVLTWENLWRVSEGGQSPVSNNYSVTPEIKLTTPKERRALQTW